MENLKDYTGELLLKEISLGNDLAFNEFYYRYSVKVYNYALRFLRYPDRSEDLTQEVFIRLWESRKNSSNIQDADAYIYTITKNLFLKALKKEIKMSFITHDEPAITPTANTTELHLDYRETLKISKDAIEALAPQTKLVYTLSRDQGLSCETISQHLEISKNTVNYHIKRSVRHIRNYFAMHSVQK